MLSAVSEKSIEMHISSPAPPPLPLLLYCRHSRLIDYVRPAALDR